MKISLNQKEQYKLKQLFAIKENNVQVSLMLSYLLENIDLYNKDVISSYQKEYSCSLNEAYFHYAIDIWELDYENRDNQIIFNNYLRSCFKESNEKDYKENPYYKNVKINEVKKNNYHLFYDQYKAYEPFPLNDIQIKENYIEQTTFSFFKTDFKFACLNLNNTTWMSITPNEINTMKNSIEKANGNVLVLGLGLGYFPYMISLKSNVKTIDIVEKDKQIVDIFKNHIYPFFNMKNKFKVVNEDAFSYLNNIKNNYDFVFVDLYHNPVDALPIYIRCKKIENQNIAHFDYWLEEGILAYLRRLVITVMEESWEGKKDKDYQNSYSEEDKIINEIYFKTKELDFKDFNQIITYLKNDSLKKLVKSLF